MHKWEEYYGSRVCLDKGYCKVIKPLNSIEVMPLSCPTCDILFRGMEDVISFKKYECCQGCAFKWAQPYREKWQDGWRPDRQEIDLHVSSALNNPTYLINNIEL